MKITKSFCLKFCYQLLTEALKLKMGRMMASIRTVSPMLAIESQDFICSVVYVERIC